MKSRKPAWWQIYVLVPLMFALVTLEQAMPLPGFAPEAVDITVIVFTFGAMLAWVNLNASLLDREEMEKDESYENLRVAIYESSSKPDEESIPAKTVRMMQSSTRVPTGRSAGRKDIEKWRIN